jgi:hypothetical protein
MLPNRCRRPTRHGDDRLCFCPADPSDVRKVLAQSFINGWVHEHWYREAKQLSGDTGASQEQLEVLLFHIEESANACYGMWRNTQ